MVLDVEIYILQCALLSPFRIAELLQPCNKEIVDDFFAKLGAMITCLNLFSKTNANF